MVVLVALLDASQDADGVHLVGLVHHHGLESALQGLVLLEILLILVERGGTDGSQFATRQGRFQNVGGIHGSLSASCAHEGVYLVDEEDDVAVGIGHFLDDALQTLLELALVLGTCHQCAHVERVELLVLQVLGHVATHDALRKSLYDSGFTCTRFADEDRVVLGSAGENLEHTAYLVVAPDNGVELSAAGLLYEVLGIFFEALIVVVGTLRLHVLSLSQFLDGSEHILLVGSCVLEDARGGGTALHDGEQYRLHAHELVAHLAGDVLGLEENLVGVAREVGLSCSLHAWQVLHLLCEEHIDLVGVHAKLLEEEVGHVGRLLYDAAQQVYRLDGLLSVALRCVHGGLYRLLRLDGKLVECHILVSFLVFMDVVLFLFLFVTAVTQWFRSAAFAVAFARRWGCE